MTRDEILVAIEQETGCKATDATPLDDLGADSLEMLSLLSELNVSYLLLPQLHTVADLIRHAETN